ncbi:TetR/AcrR family transcriptional regulator [Nocardia sp. NPDC004711]
MTGTERIYGGMSAAERRARRRRQLFEAGLDLFSQRGIAAVTISEICNKAGLIKRYFYEQFDSMDQFVDELMEDLMREQLAVEPPGKPGPQRLRSRLRMSMEAISEDPRLARFVIVETFGATGSLTRLRQSIIHRSVETLLSELDVDASGPVDRLRMEMSAYALAGAYGELVLAWVEGDVQASSEDMVNYLAELFESAADIIRSRPPTSSESECQPR